MKHAFVARAFSLALLGWCGAPVSAQESVPPSITAIHAQLYYEETGAFSGDILGRPDFALWNTVIGEGDAEYASNATLVTVEVGGKNVDVGAVNVEIRALDAKGRVLAKSVGQVALYDDKTKFYAPLFLQDTGCKSITISARLTGKGVKPKSVSRTIPFACGE